MVSFIDGQVGELHAAAHYDAKLANESLRVANPVATPPTCSAPPWALRVLRGNLTGGGEPALARVQAWPS